VPQIHGSDDFRSKFPQLFFLSPKRLLVLQVLDHKIDDKTDLAHILALSKSYNHGSLGCGLALKALFFSQFSILKLWYQ